MITLVTCAWGEDIFPTSLNHWITHTHTHTHRTNFWVKYPHKVNIFFSEMFLEHLISLPSSSYPCTHQHLTAFSVPNTPHSLTLSLGPPGPCQDNNKLFTSATLQRYLQMWLHDVPFGARALWNMMNRRQRSAGNCFQLSYSFGANLCVWATLTHTNTHTRTSYSDLSMWLITQHSLLARVSEQRQV